MFKNFFYKKIKKYVEWKSIDGKLWIYYRYKVVCKGWGNVWIKSFELLEVCGVVLELIRFGWLNIYGFFRVFILYLKDEIKVVLNCCVIWG